MMAEINLASAEDCRPLFELMTKVRALAPWEWMDETQLFGVQDPDTHEIGFVSVMGMAGEHVAIGLYRGARGLDGFWSIQERAPFFEPQDLLNTPQLQASFEDREELEKQDRDLIKTLGLKYRGKQAWPLFRSFRPGYAPWYIEPDEACFLAHALEQLLEVAPRVQKDPDILDDDDDRYLVRVAQKTPDGLVWNDETQTIKAPPPISLDISIEPELLEKLHHLPKVKNKIEADFFMVPTMIGGRGERPYFPYMVLLVESKSGAVIGTELLQPFPSLEAMWAKVGTTALEQLVKVGVLPGEIRVRSSLLYGSLGAFSRELGIKVKQSQRLPQLDMARAGFEDFLGY